MQVYSNAFNFSSFIGGGVDPRTGLYGSRIKLVSLKPDGPSENEREIALSFSMLNQSNGNYGLGWDITAARFDPRTDQLRTLSGEVNTISNFPSVGNLLQFRDRKLQDLFVRQIDSNTLHILHKDGVMEVLRPLVVNGVFVMRELVFENGEIFDFVYDGADRLASIRNRSSGVVFLTLDYPMAGSALLSSASVIKDGGRTARYDFSYANGELSAVVIPSASAPPVPPDPWNPPVPGIQPRFSFQYVSLGSIRAISRLDSPTGARDNISYRISGHDFLPGQSIPNVQQVITDAPPSQSVTKNYNYSLGRNFTGFPFASFNPRDDNIYVQAAGYEYYTEERTMSGTTVLESKTYTFNRFHLEISEVTSRAGNSIEQRMDYNVLINESFAAQPANMHLPRAMVTTYRTAQGYRSETTTMTTDDFGNQLSINETNGVVHKFEYYPVAGAPGCPAEPFGLFERFVREERVIPAGGNESQAKVTSFTYDDVRTVGNTNGFVVLSTSTEGGLSSSYMYVPTENHRDHGRPRYSETTVNGLDTRTDFEYSSSAPATLDEHKRVTGFDGTQLSMGRSVSSAVGLLLSTQKNDAVAINFTYDLYGRILSETVSPGTANAATRQYRYSFAQQISQTTHLAAVVTTDAKGVRYIRRFDGLSRHVSTHLERGSTEQLLVQKTYNLLGQLVTQTEVDLIDGEQRSLRTQFFYDGWGRVNRTIRPDNTVVLSQFDPITNVSVQGVEGGPLIQSHYNKFEKVQYANMITADGAEIVKIFSREFDGLGRCIFEDDVDGNATRFIYDDYDRIMTETFTPASGGAGRKIDYSYAAHAIEPFKTSIVVNNAFLLGRRSYDGVGRLISEWRGGNMSATTFTYENNTHNPSAIVPPTAVRRDLDYNDQLNSISEVKVNRQSVSTFGYHPTSGGMSVAVNSEFTRQLQEDEFGRIVTDTQSFQGQSHSNSYTYSTVGRLTKTESALGDTEIRTYDAFGRMTGAALSGGQNTPSQLEASYDNVGRVSAFSTTADGQTFLISLSYDAFGREASRQVMRDGSVFQAIKLQYLRNNKIAFRQIVDADDAILSEEAFSYDSYGRLTTYTCAGLHHPKDQLGRSIRSQQFTYDALDNIVRVTTGFVDGTDDQSTRSFTPNDPTRLTQVTHTNPPQTIVLAYDAAGNLTSDGARIYNFNAWNQVVSVVKDRSVVASYGYDATGRQARLSDAAANTATLHYSEDRIIGMRQGDATVRHFRNQETVLARSISGIGTELYVNDLANSVRTVAGPEQQVAHVQYAPYGDSDIDDNSDANGSATLLQRFRPAFNGEHFDPWARVYHLGNGRRAYSPELMIFLSPDPLSPFGRGGINAYAYCHGDPINFSDPSGLISQSLAISWGLLAISAFATIALIVSMGTGVILFSALTGVVLAASLISLGTGIASLSLDTIDEITGSDHGTSTFVLNVISGVTGAIGFKTGIGNAVYRSVQTTRRLRSQAHATTTALSSEERIAQGGYAAALRNTRRTANTEGLKEFRNNIVSYERPVGRNNRFPRFNRYWWGVNLATEAVGLGLDSYSLGEFLIYMGTHEYDEYDLHSSKYTTDGMLTGMGLFSEEFGEAVGRIRDSAILG